MLSIQKKIEMFAEKFDRQIEHPPFPIKIQFEVTNSCNQNCVFCFRARSKRKTKHISTWLVDKILSESRRLGVQTISFTAGAEPLMHPKLETLIYVSNLAEAS